MNNRTFNYIVIVPIKLHYSNRNNLKERQQAIGERLNSHDCINSDSSNSHGFSAGLSGISFVRMPAGQNCRLYSAFRCGVNVCCFGYYFGLSAFLNLDLPLIVAISWFWYESCCWLFSLIILALNVLSNNFRGKK